MVKIEVFDREDLICVIKLDGDTARIYNPSGKKNVFCPYITKEAINYSVSIQDLDKFLELRCVPRTRVDIDWLLKHRYNMKYYSALGICRKTHGVMYSDFIWLRFDDERISFNDIRIR